MCVCVCMYAYRKGSIKRPGRLFKNSKFLSPSLHGKYGRGVYSKKPHHKNSLFLEKGGGVYSKGAFN